MQIRTVKEYDLTPADEARIATLLAAAFTTDFGGRSYYQQRHHIRLMAEEGGTLLGHMALCYRDVRLADRLTPVWGLAEVCTDPRARGRGIATQMLHHAIDYTRTTHAAFFTLFGDRPLYAANGFISQPNIVTYLTLDGARTGTVKSGPDGGLMVLPLTDLAWDPDAPLDLLGHKF